MPCARATFSVGALLVLAGCVGPSDQTYAPKVYYPSGTYLHSYTQLRIPEYSAGFSRLHVTEYDPDRANISGHYSEPTIPIAATVYHYPANADASPPTQEEFVAHFEQTKSDVMLGNPGAELLESHGIDATINRFELSGAHARFRTPGHPAFAGPADSHLYLFALDGWYLKFRFSHPEDRANLAVPEEEAFLTSIEWPVPE